MNSKVLKPFKLFIMSRVLFAVISPLSFSKNPSNNKARPDFKFEIMGIKLGDSSENVIKVLGKPIGIRTEGNQIVYRYNGATIGFENNDVVSVFLYDDMMSKDLILKKYDTYDQIQSYFGNSDSSIGSNNAESGFSDYYYYYGDNELGFRISEEGYIFAYWISKKDYNDKSLNLTPENELLGIKIGASLNEVISKEGNPKQVSRRGSVKELLFNGFSVSFENDIVNKVVVYGKGLQSSEGLIVGVDTIHDLLHLYGEYKYENQKHNYQKEISEYYYPQQEYVFGVRFKTLNIVSFWIESKRQV